MSASFTASSGVSRTAQPAAPGVAARLVRVARSHSGIARCWHDKRGAVSTPVVLGGFHEFALFLGPLRRLLFFRRQGRFLLIFSFIFDGFRHGVRSQYLCGGLQVNA